MFISSSTYIQLQAIGHLALSGILLTKPLMATDIDAIYVLGEAMKLKHTDEFNIPDAPLTIIAILLAYIGFSDYVAAGSMFGTPAREIDFDYWKAQSSVRILFFFVLSFACWFLQPGMTSVPAIIQFTNNIKNHLTFGWSFFEFLSWSWFFLTIRSEHQSFLQSKNLERKGL